MDFAQLGGEVIFCMMFSEIQAYEILECQQYFVDLLSYAFKGGLPSEVKNVVLGKVMESWHKTPLAERLYSQL